MKVSVAVLLLLVSASQIIISSESLCNMNGQYLETFNDEAKLIAWKQNFHDDVKHDLQKRSEDFGYSLGPRDNLQVRGKFSNFNPQDSTVEYIVTGSYRFHTGDYCNDAEHNATYKEVYRRTVRVSKKLLNKISWQSICSIS